MTFRILWAINLVLAAIIGWFFVAGLVDGSVFSFNSDIWFVILFAVGAVLLSAYMLRVTGYARLAYLPLLALAVPGALYGVFWIAVIFSGTTWN